MSTSPEHGDFEPPTTIYDILLRDLADKQDRIDIVRNTVETSDNPYLLRLAEITVAPKERLFDERALNDLLFSLTEVKSFAQFPFRLVGRRGNQSMEIGRLYFQDEFNRVPNGIQVALLIFPESISAQTYARYMAIQTRRYSPIERLEGLRYGLSSVQLSALKEGTDPFGILPR